MNSFLETTSDVIDALGGTGAVAVLTGRESNAVSNWRSRGTFPPEVFLTMTERLRLLGRAASPSLWRQVPPAPPDGGASSPEI